MSKTNADKAAVFGDNFRLRAVVTVALTGKVVDVPTQHLKVCIDEDLIGASAGPADTYHTRPVGRKMLADAAQAATHALAKLATR